MKIQILFLATLTCIPIAPLHAADPPAQKELTTLFNGKDLAGWRVFGGRQSRWGAEDDMLFTKRGGGGWLMTEKAYGNFELEFEYRLPTGGNSGVAIRASLQGNPAYHGMEIQLLDDETFAKTGMLRPTQYCGSIYDLEPAAKHVSKPAGEWNRMRIVALDTKITIEHNGTPIVNADLLKHKKKVSEGVGYWRRARPGEPYKARRHPGLLNPKGHIGFQSYNLRVDFKNIKIRELPDKM